MSRRLLPTLLLLAGLVALGLWLAERVGPRPETPATATAEQTARRDLAADEAAGGHTLARHVGRSDADLARRLERERSLAAASSFTDRATAERVVATAIAAESRRIGDWLGRRRGTNLVVRWRGDGAVVGRVLERDRDGARAARAARLVLRKRGDGYFVLTAYPEAPR